MKRVVKQLVKKVAPKKTDDLLEVTFDPRRDGRVMKEWISIADRKRPWLPLAREAYRFVKSGK